MNVAAGQDKNHLSNFSLRRRTARLEIESRLNRLRSRGGPISLCCLAIWTQGNYAFLAPGLTNSTASGSTGKAYTLRLVE